MTSTWKILEESVNHVKREEKPILYCTMQGWMYTRQARAVEDLGTRYSEEEICTT
jgi:hypothetical protein